MPESPAEPSLRAYMLVLRRRRWWVAVFALAGLMIGLTLSLTGQKQYSATAQLLVQVAGGIDPAVGYSQNPVTPTDVQTELQLIRSAPVQSQVRARLGTIPAVSAAEVGQTNVIAVTAVATNPARAALIANTYARAFVTARTAATISNLAAEENQLTGQINGVTRQIAQLPSGSTAQLAALSNQQALLKGQLAQLQVAGSVASTGLEFVTPAQVPTGPSSPKPVQDALLSLVVGLVLGVGWAFLRDNLDDTMTDGEATERVAGAPVLATVPLVPSWRRKDSITAATLHDPSSTAAEAYRSLRTSLQFASQDRELRSFLISSPSSGEGKTTTAANLGAVLDQAGERVVVVSCDLRRPRLTAAPEERPHNGLSSVLTGQRSLDEALVAVPGTKGLWTLSTSMIVPNPTELLSGQRAREVFGELRERFDVVLIDSPPVLPVADAMILTTYADAVVLVIAAGQTRRAELRRTAEKLAQANAPVVGVVLNKATARHGYGAYGYGGYRRYSYHASGAAHANGRSAQNGLPPLSAGRPGRDGH